MDELMNEQVEQVEERHGYLFDVLQHLRAEAKKKQYLENYISKIEYKQ